MPRSSGLLAELITYDRAGFGGSDEDARPLVLQHEVDDLKTGLKALGATHDLILVAHSYGGEVATVLATQDPRLVIRAVLIAANVLSFNTDAQIARVQATFPPTMDTSTEEGRDGRLPEGVPGPAMRVCTMT